jgi:putative flippase GtrA
MIGNTAIDLSIFTLGHRALELPLVPSNALAWLAAVSCPPRD